MAFRLSSTRFKWSASGPLLALGMLLLGGDGEQQARACGWSEPLMSELTTFDPAVAGESTEQGLEYNLHTWGVGARCEECERRSMLQDWRGYFSGLVDDANWEEALLRAN